jgi:hypothetical protein
MGTPSDTEPWGFQFDGHHLVINYFVLGDQVVMSPCFWGSEPTSMEIDGETVTVCHEEVVASLAFINSLTEAQRNVAIESSTKPNESMKAAASDNIVQEYVGIRGNALNAAQKEKLLGIVEVFVARAKADVSKVRMAEVRKYLGDTYVTWAGGIEDDSGFYVRVQSPVVWVEVDCQAPGVLAGAYGETPGVGGPTQKHVHSIIRTPNGNDYGKELLRQHYLTSPHHQ